jgi:hypothetical protein
MYFINRAERSSSHKRGKIDMKSFQKYLTVGIAVALLSTATSAPATGLLGRALHKLESGKHDKGPPGGSVKVSKPENFKGVTQVVIGQFSVAYLTKTVRYGDNSLLSSASGVKTVGDLSGVDAATFQATTDAAYADFVKQLAARGISVADPAPYLANPMHLKSAPEEQGAKTRVEFPESDHADAVVYWPTGLAHRDNVLAVIQATAWSSRALVAQHEYEKTAGIPVMNVILYIDFAEPLKTSQGWTGTNVRSNQRIAISNYGSRIQLVGPKDGYMGGGTQIVLQSPIVQEGNFADASFRDTNEAGRIIGGLAGLNVQGKAKFHFAVSDQAAYKDTVLAATAKAADLFLGQMQTLR